HRGRHTPSVILSAGGLAAAVEGPLWSRRVLPFPVIPTGATASVAEWRDLLFDGFKDGSAALQRRVPRSLIDLSSLAPPPRRRGGSALSPRCDDAGTTP